MAELAALKLEGIAQFDTGAVQVLYVACRQDKPVDIGGGPQQRICRGQRALRVQAPPLLRNLSRDG